MMTQQLEVSILQAPLAAIDRRALSQAWYSALRLARDAQPVSPTRNRPANAGETSERRRDCPPVPLRQAKEAHAALPASKLHRDRANAAGSAVDRRGPRSPLARQIERLFLDPRSKIRRATLSIGRESGRVHVMLQTSGNRVRLVAVCPPASRLAVARALAEARFSLAARGFEVERCS